MISGNQIWISNINASPVTIYVHNRDHITFSYISIIPALTYPIITYTVTYSDTVLQL